MTRCSQDTRRSTPVPSAASLIATLAVALSSAAASAQVIPNPLVRPQADSASQGSETDARQTRGAAGAPTAGGRSTPSRAGRAGEGEGLPEERAESRSPAERLSNLYVSAVIGDRAVLRSLEVQVVPPMGANTVGGGAVSTGSRGTETSAGSSTVGGSGAGIGGLRSAMYVVRNGEVLPFLDKVRLLVRVRDTTVTLFDVTDVPAGNFDPLDLMDRGFPVAFRGSVDSVQALPYVPPSLIAPGAGVDGAAFDAARDTRNRGIGGSTATTSDSSSTPRTGL